VLAAALLVTVLPFAPALLVGALPLPLASLMTAPPFAPVLPLSAACAQTEFRGEIREGALPKIPIEVRDWEYVETPRRLLAGGEECEAVLVQDLAYSGFFKVEREAFPLAASSDRVVQARAEGTVRRDRDQPRLEGSLVDPVSGKLIFRKSYRLGDPPDRWAVHGFADDIVLFLTGERGVSQTKIAFVGDATGNKEIYLVDYDGASAEMKTDLRSITISPRWSPTGDRLAFTTFARGAPQLVGLRLAEGKIWTISDRPGMNSAPCWGPDGDKIACSLSFEGNSEIYLSDASGRNLRRLTWEPAIDTSPTFSPDGNRIAFTSDRSGDPQVFLMDSDGTNQHRLTFVGKHSDSPDWSPKGDRILFVSLIDRVFDICSINPDGTDLRRLTPGTFGCENPRWSPDGRQVVFARRTGGERRLFIMTADGANLRQLTWQRGSQYNPSWSPPLTRQGD
jgi:TolB protein